MANKKLKVYGVNYCGLSRRIVAATSKREAAELIGVTFSHFRGYGCETVNTKECEMALKEPGVVWSKRYRDGANGEWVRIPVMVDEKANELISDFSLAEVQLPYLEWDRLQRERRPLLTDEARAWLDSWNIWDLMCSPMDDGERRLIRLGHYLGWEASANRG